ncbi:MAG: stage II sporulation protein E [Bacillota bacterium]
MLEKVDVYPYQRKKGARGRGLRVILDKEERRRTSPGRRREASSGYLLSQSLLRIGEHRRSLALYIIGFFLGRAVLLGTLAPFGPAFAVATTLSYGGRVWPVWLAVLAGEALTLKGFTLFSVAATTLVTLIMMRLAPKELLDKLLGAPGLVAVATIVTKTAFLAFSSPTSYAYVSILFEAAFAGVLTYLFRQGLIAWREKRGLQLGAEELFCLMVIVAGVLAGSGELSAGPVSVKGVLTRLCLLFAAATGGGGGGAAAGAILGVIPGLAYTVVPEAVSNYAFAGFLGGSFRKFGRAGVVVGFALGNVLLTVYIKDLSGLSQIVAETGLATALYLLIPVRWYAGLRSSVTGATSVTPETKTFGDLVVGRLNGWADVLDELAATFSAAGAVRPVMENRTAELLAEAKERVCASCPLFRTCWQWEERETAAVLQEAVSLLEGKGYLQPGDLPPYLEKRCVKVKELTLTLSLVHETYRLNRYWYRRMVESRAVVAEQLRGISRVLQDFAGELGDGLTQVAAIETELWDLVCNGRLRVNHLQVSLREDGKVEVVVCTKACTGNLYCQRVVAPLVSDVARRPYSVAHTGCPLRAGDEECWFTLYPALRYRLSVGAMTVGKEEKVSGDSYACVEMPGGRYALILSDGMGTGAEAAMESATTVSLLELLVKAGFSEELAVKSVNSLLLLHSPGETFATVDMAVIDLYTGKLQWVKIGAAPGCIYRRDGTAEIIRTPSLPVGIVNPIEVVVVEKELEAGDLLLLTTDGLLEAYRGEEGKEEWLLQCLEEAGGGEPQRIGAFMLNRAHLAAGGPLPDDATVVVAKVVEA